MNQTANSLLAPGSSLKKPISALPDKSYHHTSDCPTPWPQHCTDPFLYLLTSLCTHYSYCGETQAQTCISVTVSLKNDLPVHFLSTKQTFF